MRKIQCLFFVSNRSYICHYIICMTVPLRLIIKRKQESLSRSNKVFKEFLTIMGSYALNC